MKKFILLPIMDLLIVGCIKVEDDESVFKSNQTQNTKMKSKATISGKKNV